MLIAATKLPTYSRLFLNFTQRTAKAGQQGKHFQEAEVASGHGQTKWPPEG